MAFLIFLRDNARWLAAGFLMALGSCFGQTFFIALFSDSIRAEFALSHGDFGAIYMLGTLASAATLIQLGRLADSRATRGLAVAVALALAGVCLFMALTPHWLLLIPAIFGLRLFGQGMISHLSQTATARWFAANRGRALAVASFGYPTAEALAPLAAVPLILAIGWRETWALSAAVAALVLAPTLWLLLARERAPRSTADAAAEERATTGRDGRHWTRGEMLRDPVFWLLTPGLIAPGFIITVVFFLPSHIAEAKGWAFETLPNRYWVYALASVSSAAFFGAMIDRFSAVACLAVYQLPMALALLALWFFDGPLGATLLLALIGVTAGAAATVHSALWAEAYGVAHLGSIKALGHAVMVFSTAAGPGIAGAAIDLGVGFPAQAVFLAVYVVLISGLFAWLALAGPLSPAMVRRNV